MSFNKNIMVACFTLALLIASHGGAMALCHNGEDGNDRTGIPCTSDAMCRSYCLGQGRGYNNGYCSTEHVVGDPSCVCCPGHHQSTVEGN
ncbi:hypothetical protein BS78_05G278000 [Paspalum vaginatum]|nr:hypothetical protein BS78_05G278000 [Paspalum vaginatum]